MAWHATERCDASNLSYLLALTLGAVSSVLTSVLPLDVLRNIFDKADYNNSEAKGICYFDTFQDVCF